MFQPALLLHIKQQMVGKNLISQKINTMKRLLLTILVIMTISLAFAQQTIRGTITDMQGEPLIGASIKAVGYTQGTITDLNGNYILKSNATEVEVSYLGYKTRKIKVTNGRADARMEESSDILDEVVVIGYGSVKKEM